MKSAFEKQSLMKNRVAIPTTEYIGKHIVTGLVLAPVQEIHLVADGSREVNLVIYFLVVPTDG